MVDDRKSGHGWVVLPRLGGRLRWWCGKLGALLVAALVGQLVLCLYEAFAFTALGAALVAITVRFSKAFIPITAAVLGLVTDYIAIKLIDAWGPLSPGRRLLESIHASFGGWHAVPLWTSLVYWGVMLGAAAIVGGWALRRVDL